MSALPSLVPFTRRAKRARDGARCEVCGVGIPDVEHRHVVDKTERRLLCACGACAVAFGGSASAGRFRTVPDRVRVVPSGSLGDADLSSLGVPVGLAFFFRPSTQQRWIGVFPSPAGPTEAELPEGGLAEIARLSVLARSIEDDVEALLVRRHRDGRCDGYVVPIDACYELAALLRTQWEGIDGGDGARRAIDGFFQRIAARAETADDGGRE